MRVKDFIVCDDIRQEMSSKFILIGVYDDAILFNRHPNTASQWPKTLKLAFFVRLRMESTDPSFDAFTMHVTFDGKSEMQVGTRFDISPEGKQNINLAIQHAAFSIPRESTMEFMLRFYSDRAVVSELVVEDRLAAKDNIQ